MFSLFFSPSFYSSSYYSFIGFLAVVGRILQLYILENSSNYRLFPQFLLFYLVELSPHNNSFILLPSPPPFPPPNLLVIPILYSIIYLYSRSILGNKWSLLSVLHCKYLLTSHCISPLLNNY